MNQEKLKNYKDLLKTCEESNNKYEIKLIIKNCISEPFLSKRVDKFKINKKQLEKIVNILEEGD